jgi:hypothetical protein
MSDPEPPGGTPPGASGPEGDPAEGGDLEPLVSTADASFLPIVESLLESAGIPYVVQGESAVGLFPLGALGTTLSGRGLAAVILVPRGRLEEARALLEETAGAARSGGPESGDVEPGGSDPGGTGSDGA